MGEELINENVSVLLDQLLKTEDPATIGIRRIIKNKVEESNSFAVKSPEMETFDQHGKPVKKQGVFSDQERAYLALEKKVRELERSLTQEKVAGKRTAAESREAGRQEGIAEGEKRGFDAADKKFSAEVAKLKDQTAKYFKQFETSKKDIINNLEHILLKFCTELTKKIVACELTTNPDIVIASIKKALTMIADREKILIRVAPGDMETASGQKDFLSSVTERLENVQIEEDSRISKGGCIIESNSGMVDARMGVQLDEMELLVEKAWESSDMSGDG
ncbi:MAG: FliH/SctL family protein [Chitinispirillia bacterium]|nr:FliH/SctL family protein [Chitinispirillia bacterium]MCL2241321.1 FliH/SctL family protein [Chitinispirillia bacterium]